MKNFFTSKINALTFAISMKAIILIFAGGGAGSLCRYAVYRFSDRFMSVYPLGTLFSNVLSCLLMGCIVAASYKKITIDPAIKLMLLTGFCGGFSTFSSLTFELYELTRNGHPGMAFLHIAGNLFICLAALMSGLFIGKFL